MYLASWWYILGSLNGFQSLTKGQGRVDNDERSSGRRSYTVVHAHLSNWPRIIKFRSAMLLYVLHEISRFFQKSVYLKTFMVPHGQLTMYTVLMIISTIENTKRIILITCLLSERSNNIDKRREYLESCQKLSEAFLVNDKTSPWPLLRYEASGSINKKPYAPFTPSRLTLCAL